MTLQINHMNYQNPILVAIQNLPELEHVTETINVHRIDDYFHGTICVTWYEGDEPKALYFELDDEMYFGMSEVKFTNFRSTLARN